MTGAPVARSVLLLVLGGATLALAVVSVLLPSIVAMECLSDSSMMVPGGGPMAGPRESVDQDRYRRCMAERGYSAGAPK